MNKLRTELKSALTRVTAEAGDRVTAVLACRPGFIGFQGHFPERAVLPGMCCIQAVLVLCEQWKSSPAVLREVVVAKFFQPAEIGDELELKCRETPRDDGLYLVRADMTRGGERMARIDVIIGYEHS